MTAITSTHSYSENITILVDSWNTGLEAAKTFGKTLNETVTMLYDQNKADTVRQALQMIGSDLYGKAASSQHRVCINILTKIQNVED